jgi:hypothetical protein
MFSSKRCGYTFWTFYYKWEKQKLNLGLCVPYYNALHPIHPGMLKTMHNNLKSQIKLCLLEMLKQDLNPS